MKSLLPIALLATSGAAFANETYIGIDYFHTTLDIAEEESKPKMLNLRLGTELTDKVFLEGQYMVSSQDDDLFRLNMDFDKSYATFLRFESLSKSDLITEVSLGYASTDIKTVGPDGSYSGIDNVAGFAWGIALNQKIKWVDGLKLRLGYQSLYDKDDIKIDGVTFGFTYSF